MPSENVTAHVTLLGGGFGRKSKPDFAVEAALLSKQMDGMPVKLLWTREDDLHHDYYHTVSVERLHAGLDKDVVVVGMGPRIELWNPDNYLKHIIKDPADLSSLMEKYLS